MKYKGLTEKINGFETSNEIELLDHPFDDEVRTFLTFKHCVHPILLVNLSLKQ